MKEFKTSNGGVKSLFRKVTVVRRGGGWDGTVTAFQSRVRVSLGLAERNAWGSVSILIGVAKSATPGEGLPEVILGDWLEVLSRKELGCQ